VILVDAGVQGEPTIEADVSRQEVARAAEAVEELATAGDRGAAVETMARGAAAIVERLTNRGDSTAWPAWAARAEPRSSRTGCNGCPWGPRS